MLLIVILLIRRLFLVEFLLLTLKMVQIGMETNIMSRLWVQLGGTRALTLHNGASSGI